MTGLTAGKKARKQQSEFQKLWVKAEKLKKENASFRESLDQVMQRIQTEIRPLEEASIRQHIPLLKRLLTLGQRKSLAQWQRQELDGWIREILEPLQGSGIANAELLDEVSRYDAFRYGVTLDETSSVPLADQMHAHFDLEEQQIMNGFEADEALLRQTALDDIESILDNALGPEPDNPDAMDARHDDMFEDALKQEKRRQYEAYHEERDVARKAFLEELFSDAVISPGDDEEAFNFDGAAFDFNESFPADTANDKPAISNAVFTKLFRSTAGNLHPDRESDPEKRQKKQALMARLLSARKQGDVMCILEMYQEYVGGTELTKADEKELIQSLKKQIGDLRNEREAYSFESPFHRMAYEQFYRRSHKKIDQAFQQHIVQMEDMAAEAQQLSASIKSIKTLRPYLEQRYDENRFISPFQR